MVLQSMWSVSVAAIEGYAWLLSKSLQDSPLLRLFALGDWVTAVVTLAGACASAAITILFVRDIRDDCVKTYCRRYASAAGMAFVNWTHISTSFLFTFWVLTTR
eukprot:c53606_g1_i1 orf=122-433(+)